MPHTKGVEGALRALRESRQALVLAHAVHAVPAAGQYFMRIGLVSYIPDNTIVRRVKNVMQSNREFNHAEPSPEVPACSGYCVEEVVPQLLCQPHQLVRLETGQQTQIRRDGVEQRRVWFNGGQFLNHVIDHTPRTGLGGG